MFEIGECAQDMSIQTPPHPCDRWTAFCGQVTVRGRKLDRTHKLARLARFDVPLFLHVDAVVNGVPGLMVVVDPKALRLSAAAESVASQMALVSVSLAARSGRRSGKFVLEKALVRVRAAAADTRVASYETSPDGREGQEYADDGDALGSELGNCIVEVEASEDSWEVLAHN
jgi:hypothetical protein